MFCTSQIPSLAYGTTSGRVLMSEYKCGICTNKQLSWEKEFTLMKKYLEHLCKVGNINVLVLDAGSNFRYFDFFVKYPTDLQAVHEMALYLQLKKTTFSLHSQNVSLQTPTMGSCHKRHGHFCVLFMMEVLSYFMREKRIMKKKTKTSRMRRKSFNRNETIDR